jgi:hypothetical protein
VGDAAAAEGGIASPPAGAGATADCVQIRAPIRCRFLFAEPILSAEQIQLRASTPGRDLLYSGLRSKLNAIRCGIPLVDRIHAGV